MMNRPYAWQTLPEGYQKYKNLDLIKDQKLLILLSLASVGLFIASWAGLAWLLIRLRPDLASEGVSFSLTSDSTGSFITPLLVLLAVIIAMVILHEAIHGLFFHLFTGGKVKFAFKGAYAYAAAPDWYVDKAPYMLISLAPLVLITVLGVILLLFVPVGWISPVMLLIALNASGAIGDIYVFFLLLRTPGDVLIQDFGEQMDIFIQDGRKPGY
jgi:hypothetical protein